MQVGNHTYYYKTTPTKLAWRHTISACSDCCDVLEVKAGFVHPSKQYESLWWGMAHVLLIIASCGPWVEQTNSVFPA